VGTALSELQTGVEALSLAWADWTAGVVSTSVGVVGANAAAADSIGWLQKSIGFVTDALQTLRLGFLATQSYLIGGIGHIVGAFGMLDEAIVSVLNLIPGLEIEGSSFFKTWSEDLRRLSEDEWGKFKAELAKPPASEGVNDYFALARQRIRNMRSEAAKSGPDISKLSPKDATAAKIEAPKFANAMREGSQEAVNAELRARFGGGMGNTAADQTAKNTAATTQAIRSLPEQIATAIARISLGGNPLQAFGNF
jgi:hypothetical protein